MGSPLPPGNAMRGAGGGGGAERGAPSWMNSECSAGWSYCANCKVLRVLAEAAGPEFTTWLTWGTRIGPWQRRRDSRTRLRHPEMKRCASGKNLNVPRELVQITADKKN
jgi:hypothetical protein